MSKRSPTWRRYLRFWGVDPATDVSDEISFHLEMRIRDYVERGMSPDEARRTALARFGNVQRAQAECVTIDEHFAHREYRMQLFDSLLQDARFSLRVIRRQLLPALAAVCCLAIGVGATTAMFSVANTLLLRPLPYPNGDRLVQISSSRTENARLGVVSYATFQDFRSRQRAFEYLAAVGSADFTMLRNANAERVRGSLVSGDFFEALGGSPEYGRLFSSDDDAPDREPIIVVSHAFAAREFGDPVKAIDQKILIGNAPRRIVGVLPDLWRYPSRSELWMPITRRPGDFNRGDRNLVMIGALRRGVSLAAARQNMTAVSEQLEQDHPESEKGYRAYVTPLHEVMVGDSRGALFAMMVAASLVLLVACANVAALQLARATSRVREIAVRAAIGAQHGRLLRQLLTESAMLALAGGVAGCGLAYWARDFVASAVISGTPAWMTFDIDLRALSFALAVSMTTGVVFGVVPALRLSRLDPAVPLRGGIGGVSHTRLQHTFVTVEMALAITLAVCAMMAVQSIRAIRAIPTGIRPSGVVIFEIAMQGHAYDDRANRARFVAALEDRLRTMPGVSAAGATTYAPISTCCSQFPARIEGQSIPDNDLPAITGNIVTPGFLDAMGIGLVKGREIQNTDDASAPPVTIINETFAKRYWPAGDALGKHVNTGTGHAEIVGIVHDVKQGSLYDASEPQFYRPYAQDPWTHMTFAVHVRSGDPTRVMPDVRRALRDLDPTVPMYSISSMDDVIRAAMASQRVFGELLVAFAIIALSLASAGVYAVTSFFVAQRTRELGLRVALGADPSRVARFVVRQTAVLAILAALVGTAGAAIGARWLAHMLYGVNGASPAIYASAVVVLVGAALVATVGPARRASGADPMVALRADN